MGALALAGCTSSGSVERIDAAEAIGVVAEQQPTVVDVRTPAEFAEGHVPGAVNIDLQGPDFAGAVGELPKDETYVVICRSGNRSAQATKIMADLGFSSLYDVDGGVVAWAGAGGALE